jgi:hypothetical protein
MLRRLILTFALALLFGLGQQAAIEHEISHYSDLAPLSQKQDKAPHICEKCLSYSGLANAIGGSSFTTDLLTTSFEPALISAQSHDSLTLSHYYARAPPRFA